MQFTYSVKSEENIYMCVYKLILSFTVITDVYMSFIPNKTTLIKLLDTVWLSGFRSSRVEIHCVMQYPVNFTGLAGIVNAAVCKTEKICTGLWYGRFF